ncbi:MAG: hypothetical protein U0167_09705 [bacterium]
MSSTRVRVATSLAAAALALLARGALADPPPPPADAAADSAETSPGERRCDELADRLDKLAADVQAKRGDRDVALLEAREIAKVADELVAEGEADVAASLFEEALALLEPPGTPR